MRTPTPRPLPCSARLLAALACALLLHAPPAGASGGALLELYFGPTETEWLRLQALTVTLDGEPVPVQVPARGADPAQPLCSRAMAPGAHTLEVLAALTGDSSVFTYIDDVRFSMRGKLGLDAKAGQLVGVQGRVLARGELNVPWEDRYHLSLTAASFPSERAAAVDAPAPPAPAQPPGEPAQPPQAQPSGPAAATQATACALEPVHFAFDRAELDATARAALERFARCLSGTSAAIRLEGHCDVRGSAEDNQRLGERRALSVARYLEALGVPPSRLERQSFGKSRPLCSEATRACHARNRRVEAVLLE